MKTTLNMKQSWRFLTAIAIFLAGVTTIIGSTPTPRPVPGQQSSSVVNVVQLDFEPIGSTNNNLTCTQNHMVYTDAKQFMPLIRLAEPAPTGFSYHYWVQEDGFLSNPTIGYFHVRFNAGDIEPSLITTENVEATVETFMGVEIARMPIGAPPQQTGSFWLGCTKLCIIRGNGPKAGGGSQNVFLSTSSLVVFDDASRVSSFTGLVRTPNHAVQCLP